MSRPHSLEAGGFQIAFFVIALLLLSAAIDKHLAAYFASPREVGLPTGRLVIFAFATAVLFGLPRVRRRCAELLAVRIPAEKRKEVAAVAILDIVAIFAALGAIALWTWSVGGEPALARKMGEESGAAARMSRALSLGGIVTSLFLAGLVAPVIEELVFRGMLYPAWAARWGWLPSTLATSALFQVIHPLMISQFLGSILFICLYRRTGSLRACIFVHAISNVLMWYPMLGRFVLPSGRETGELAAWTFHLVCLGATCLAIPAYMWMARDRP